MLQSPHSCPCNIACAYGSGVTAFLNLLPAPHQNAGCFVLLTTVSLVPGAVAAQRMFEGAGYLRSVTEHLSSICQVLASMGEEGEVIVECLRSLTVV